MKLIVITTPQFFEGEAEAVTSLFQNGLEMLHLRKPGASAEEMGNFLQQLPMEYMPRIVTHEQFQLASVFGLKGIHLNGRNPQIPSGYKGHVSRSCHSLEEVGIIDSKVMALGGITLEHLPEIAALGFGGAVLLGDVWQQAKEAFIPHFLHLKQLSSHPFNF